MDVAGVVLLWPHELAVNLQTNEILLFIAYFIDF